MWVITGSFQHIPLDLRRIALDRSMEHQRNITGIRAVALENRLISFAIRVCDIAEELPPTAAGRHVCGQLLRSGTSAAPNYAEAQSAESRPDFVHKLKIALKELRETQVWLKFIQQKNYPLASDTESIIKEADELISIFVKSIQTAQRNHQPKSPHTRR
jgi:four helix bundle protein